MNNNDVCVCERMLLLKHSPPLAVFTGPSGYIIHPWLHKFHIVNIFFSVVHLLNIYIHNRYSRWILHGLSINRILLCSARIERVSVDFFVCLFVCLSFGLVFLSASLDRARQGKYENREVSVFSSSFSLFNTFDEWNILFDNLGTYTHTRTHVEL